MTISKRLISVARANLNDLLDKLRDVAGWEEEEERREQERGTPRRTAARRAKDPFLEEAEKELEEALKEAKNSSNSRVRPRPEVRSTDDEARRWVEGRQRRTNTRAQSAANAGAGRRPSSNQIARHYATLNLSNGSSLAKVKDSYRSLMRDYHPDRYVNDPARHRIATEVSQKLSRAYMELKKHLGEP